MRVTFPRLPDGQRAHALVERDDGVCYRLYGGTDLFPGSQLPQDIRRLIVERELGIGDGIWAGIAAGVVFASMQRVGGRPSPHPAERTRELMPKSVGPGGSGGPGGPGGPEGPGGPGGLGLRAELLANLVESVAALDRPTEGQIRRLAETKLANADVDVDPAAIAAAATAMQVEAARWARLRIGEELCYDWPGRPARRRAG
jgi:hypothetical protein